MHNRIAGLADVAEGVVALDGKPVRGFHDGENTAQASDRHGLVTYLGIKSVCSRRLRQCPSRRVTSARENLRLPLGRRGHRYVESDFLAAKYGGENKADSAIGLTSAGIGQLALFDQV